MKLTILGGGGFRVPQVVEAVSGPAAPVRVDEVALYDTDPQRLAVIARVLDGTPGAPRLTATTDLDEALRGADFVFAAVRVGGTAGRILDERVALDLGLLGQETVGPGGLAYALRTVPVMVEIARRIRLVAPQAWVINFTNPAGLVTEAMRAELGDRVVGICDTPIGLMRRAARALGLRRPPEGPGSFDYVGLNHLGWLRALHDDGLDRLPELLADDASLTRLEEARLMGPDWVRALGALPNEYLFYYYLARDARERIRAAAQTRGEFLDRQQAAFYQAAAGSSSAADAWHAAHEEREATYMAEARDDERDPADADGGYHQVAARLMAALSTGAPATMILDVPNRGLVPQLPDDAVIEVGCVVDGDGVHPWPIAPVEPAMLGLMTQVKAVERLTIEAALTGSATLAWRAFAQHPLVDSVAVARRLVDGYRDAFALPLT